MAAGNTNDNDPFIGYLNSPEDEEDDDPNQLDFELFSQLLEFDDWVEGNTDEASMLPAVYYPHTNPVFAANGAVDGSIGSSSHLQLQQPVTGDSEIGQAKNGRKEKVAFKTKSEIEILEDGFKWRKYGKKKVKNSPNPRNYYRCSFEGCPVKKRVERDVEDARYVVTTYEGVHTHEGPSKF